MTQRRILQSIARFEHELLDHGPDPEVDELAGVITEDVRTRPTKLSLKDACGLLRIVSVSVFPYLEQNGIWPG
jgi:hypothetical protein